MPWIEPPVGQICEAGCRDRAPNTNQWPANLARPKWFSYKDGRWACSQGCVYKIAEKKKPCKSE